MLFFSMVEQDFFAEKSFPLFPGFGNQFHDSNRGTGFIFPFLTEKSAVGFPVPVVTGPEEREEAG